MESTGDADNSDTGDEDPEEFYKRLVSRSGSAFLSPKAFWLRLERIR